MLSKKCLKYQDKEYKIFGLFFWWKKCMINLLIIINWFASSFIHWLNTTFISKHPLLCMLFASDKYFWILASWAVGHSKKNLKFNNQSEQLVYYFCSNFFQIYILYLILSPESFIYDNLGVDTNLGYIPFHTAFWPRGHTAKMGVNFKIHFRGFWKLL